MSRPGLQEEEEVSEVGGTYPEDLDLSLLIATLNES